MKPVDLTLSRYLNMVFPAFANELIRKSAPLRHRVRICQCWDALSQAD
jgi:hypothetical protein